MEKKDLYSYLENNFGTVTILDNGVYYSVDQNGNEFYINPNYLTNTNLVVYYPGKGGPTDNTAGSLREGMLSETPSEFCAIIGRSAMDESRILDLATTILNDNGILIDNILTSGNSMSGGIVLERTSEFLTLHPEYADSTIIDINDGVNMKNSYKYYDVLKENNVPIIGVAATDHYGNDMRNFVARFTNNGYNAYFLSSDDHSHAGMAYNFFKNKMPEYLMGTSSTHGNYGGSRTPNYALKRYNNSTRTFDQANFEEVILTSVIPNYDTNYSVDDFLDYEKREIEIVDNSRYTNLTYLNDRISFRGLNTSSKIASDMQYILNSVNAIKSQIKTSNVYTNKTQVFANTSTIPGCISKYINAYYDVLGELMNKMNQELNSIISLGQAMIDMDNDLSNQAGTILFEGSDFLSGINLNSRRFNSEDPLHRPPFQPRRPLLDRDPSSFKNLHGNDYYLGARRTPVVNGAQQGYMDVNGYEISTDSKNGKVYITYTDENGQTRKISYTDSNLKNAHLGGLATHTENGELYVSLATGDHFTTYKVDDLINANNSAVEPVGQSAPGALQVGNNSSGRMSWIGNGGENGLIVAGQYENASAPGTKYYNNGSSSSEIGIFSRDESGNWNLQNTYTIDGADMTNLQGGCIGDDGYLYLTSSRSNGNSRLYVAQINQDDNTVSYLGDVPLAPGAEQVSFSNGELVITYEGNGSNGYLSYIDPDALRSALYINND